VINQNGLSGLPDGMNAMLIWLKMNLD